MTEPQETHNTPSPFRRHRTAVQQQQVQQAWATSWRVLGFLIPICVALIGVVWAQGRSEVERVEHRVERVEQRTVQALERIDGRLTSMERNLWNRPATPAASSP